MYDNTEVLEEVKLLLGITDASKDAILLLLSNQCLTEFYNYTHVDEYDDKYKPVIENMICYRYSIIGSEGLNSENYTGYSVSYQNDYPPFIKESLDRFRRVRFR